MTKLYAAVTGCTGIISVETEASYGAITSSAVVECTASTLTLGDAISIDIGYDVSHGVVLDGFVKKVEMIKPDRIYRITANDLLVRAVDFFIAADDPESPLQYNNISDYNLVNSLLGLAGLPGVVSGAPSPSFTFGTNEDGARFNLQSVADALQFILSVTGRTLYAESGDIYYVDRKPYIVTGDTPTVFLSAGNNLIDISYEESNDKIRNVIKVYGKSPLTAKASASSPYLVVDQTAVIAHELLDTQEICQATADVNLEILNRLGRTWAITCVGDHTIRPRAICRITDEFATPTPTDAFIYRVSHQFSESGFVTQITAIT